MMLLGLLDQAVLTAAAQKEDAGQVRLFGSLGSDRFPRCFITRAFGRSSHMKI